jgi:hypothetical protein
VVGGDLLDALPQRLARLGAGAAQHQGGGGDGRLGRVLPGQGLQVVHDLLLRLGVLVGEQPCDEELRRPAGGRLRRLRAGGKLRQLVRRLLIAQCRQERRELDPLLTLRGPRGTHRLQLVDQRGHLLQRRHPLWPGRLALLRVEQVLRGGEQRPEVLPRHLDFLEDLLRRALPDGLPTGRLGGTLVGDRWQA